MHNQKLCRNFAANKNINFKTLKTMAKNSNTANTANTANNQANNQEQANKVIKNTTLNQLLERAKQVRKDVNSLNGVLKSLYKEDIFKNLFDAVGAKTYDEARLLVIKSVAYGAEDNNGKFVAVTLKPVCKLSNITYYKVVKLDWYTAISQATYRLARNKEAVQKLAIDSYYQATDIKEIFEDVTDASLIAEIDKQIKIDKYNKAVDRANKLKLEF